MSHADQTGHEFLTVKELAALLRIKERKVYELASTGEVPVSRVTGKLLFPQGEIRAWIASSRTGGDAGAAAGRPPILLGSHDPLLDWAVRQSKCGLATRCDGSFDGLDRFAAGEGVAAGLHLRDEAGEWNVPHAARRFGGENVVLVAWARRRRGLVIRPEDAAAVRGLADLAGRRIAARPTETGTQALFENMLALSDVAITDLEIAESAPSEDHAVQCVAQAQADAAFGLECFARLYNLAFVPLVEERFDLLVDRKAWFDPPLQTLFDFVRSAPFRAHAGGMAGYDAAEIGAVRWNA